jgi:hypothetical protein
MNKQCSCCKASKDMKTEFYFSRGKYRSECKKCTIHRNLAYQRKVKAWRKRISENSREYALQYYQDNKERFAHYRKTFLERHPGYYRDYADKRRGEKYEGDSRLPHSRHEMMNLNQQRKKFTNS